MSDKAVSFDEVVADVTASVQDANIDWVIVGGESGVKARPMKREWVVSIKEQSENQGSAFFFKQWGAWGSDGVKRSKKLNGILIDGETYQSMPLLRTA